MATIDYEVGLSEEERAVRETAHRFAAEVMRPAGATLDALADPEDVIADGSILWEVYEKYRALGLAEITAPNADRPAAEHARLRCIVTEELGWGDSGLAISFGVAGFPRMMAEMSGNAELIEVRDARASMIEDGCNELLGLVGASRL